MDYWHGSREPLSPGTELLSARARGVSDRLRLELVNLVDVDKVYITTDPDYARAWVARRGGALLRVEPRGRLFDDPDTPGLGYAVESAVVLEVAESPVEMGAMDIRKTFALVDPSRYDDKGFMIPQGDFLSDFVAQGLTREDCRKFGRWANPHRIVQNPETGEFVYLADDFEFVRATEARNLLDAGMSFPEVQVHLLRPEVENAMRKHVLDNPVAWV